MLSYCAETVVLAEGASDVSAAVPRPGTVKMAALLEEINRKNDAVPMQNPFANDARAAAMRMQLTAMADPAERAYALANISVELLNAGDVDEALVAGTKAMTLAQGLPDIPQRLDRKSTRLNSS